MNKKLFWAESFSDKLKAFRRKVYSSKRWRQTRLFVITQHPFCEMCVTEGKYKPAVDVDHIIPLSRIFFEELDRELLFDTDNLRGLCKQHHGEKSGKEAQEAKQKLKLKPRNENYNDFNI